MFIDKLILITLSFLLSIHTVAQPSLKAGINVNDLGGKEAGIYNSMGFHAGLSIEHAWSDYFSLQPELLFSLQGGAFGQSSNTRLNYYYLNLPLLARIYLAENFSLDAGPQFSYLLSAKRKDDFGSFNISDQVKKTDFAIAFGFGYKYRKVTNFSIRYCLGITNTNEQGVIFRRRLNNRVLQASVGFAL